MKFRYSSARQLVATLLTAATLVALQAIAADGPNPQESAAKRQKLIQLIQSNAQPQEKAIACKQLAVYGDKDAVPALAALLPDQNLSSWARIALEAIPDPAVDAALRDALSKVQGRLLIGVINSIGVRHNADATEPLIGKLKDSDPQVAAAAAVALGHIGNSAAAKALEQNLASSPASVRADFAEGCILCAEQLLAKGSQAESSQLYDFVRKADVPKQRQLEAVRGAILSRKADGIPLLVEVLKSEDKAMFGIALRVVREVTGAKATETLAAELDRLPADRQDLFLLALADRGDEAIWPIVFKQAKSGQKKTKIMAVRLLERLDNLSCIPVLLEAAADTDAALAQTAKASLSRFSGPEVDADLCSRLTQSQGKTKQVVIELITQKKLEKALPSILTATEDADAGVRIAAINAIGVLGKEKQAADLAALFEKDPNVKERRAVEKALQTLSSRCGTATIPYLMPLTKNSDSALRIVGLHALASVGGPEALAAVKAAMEDKTEAVQDEAVSTLSTWANNWPEDAGVAEPLLALAKSGKKPAYQVLGIRGYLQFVQGDKLFKNEEKAAKIKEALPLIVKAEEKRFVVSVLESIPTPGSIDLLINLASDADAVEEASLALVNTLSKEKSKIASKEQRQKALQTVLDKSKNASTKQKAEALLKK